MTVIIEVATCILSGRWDRSKSPTVDNLVLVTGEEADEHDANGVETLASRNTALFKKIISKLAEVSEAFGISSSGS